MGSSDRGRLAIVPCHLDCRSHCPWSAVLQVLVTQWVSRQVREGTWGLGGVSEEVTPQLTRRLTAVGRSLRGAWAEWAG